MRALSIRQPWAELILRGVKTVEYRSRPTRIIGERFYIYASKTSALVRKPANTTPPPVWSADLVIPGRDEQPLPPAWMLQLADKLILSDLPTGVIVGSAVIEKVTPYDRTDGLGFDGLFRWHLRDVERAKTFRKPKGHPQPVWFAPF
jgi:hypothetical protein